MLKSVISTILKDKSLVGVGTGRTVESVIKYLPPSLKYVSSSHQSTLSLASFNIHSLPVETQDHLDLYIDGCDYFDKEGNMIKGKGGSLTTEKLLCSMSSEVLIVVQDYKYREKLEGCFVPIEILPQSTKYIEKILKEWNIKYELRTTRKKFGPVVTDLGNFIIDIEFNKEFIMKCKEYSGVIEHGYFESKDYNIKMEIYEEI